MAAGVGKTYRMLQEGQAEAEAGRDVVVGLVETHGRAETAAHLGGLEIVPRRRVDYRGTELEEMDLPALLARAPELALIDELAHSNAPGVEHAKRYEDITDVLAAGIDVFSTVNVQHLESLNDRVAELTGTRVRETVPDSVIARRRRDRPRRPHPGGADRAPAGRQGLSPGARGGRAQPLLPDREPGRAARGGAARGRRGGRDEAARRAARAARHPRRPRRATEPQAIQERLLALITPAVPARRPPRGALGAAARRRARPALRPALRARAERRGARAARGAAPPRRRARRAPADRGGRRRRRGRRARRARARHHLRPDRRAQRAARPAPLRSEPLHDRLLKLLPGVDLRIVADRAARRTSPQT